MPRRKKKPIEMTTDELARLVFPKQVVQEVKRIAQEQNEKPEPKRKRPSEPD